MPKYEEILQCKGYFGFGGGYAAGDGLSNSSYCNRCSVRDDCWAAHAARVRRMFPTLSHSIDQLGADTGLEGDELLSEFRRRFSVEHDPFTSVMRGNIEDGLLVGRGMPPVDRDRFSLPYPFRADQRA